MKTHPTLLLRDALAAQFVAAARGDAAARAVLGALAAWGGRGTSEGLEGLRVEDGGSVFRPDGMLAERFADLEAYARDRALRYAHALAWIDEAGCTGEPLECARAAWDAALFFEVHELLEPEWQSARGARRALLQGLIMAGAAFHHLVDGNLAGARGLLRDAARRLEEAPPDVPFALERFASGLRGLAEGIDSGRVRGADDVEEVPRLERSDAS